MARFRLNGKHYLNVPETEWEQIEITLTGKQHRHRYKVHAYLDPEDPSDHNYPGEIIVATKASRAHPKDIIFVGSPTLDMEPLDDEAEALIAEVAARGAHPIESLPATGGNFSENLLAALQQEFAKLNASLSGRAAPQESEVEILRKQNAELQRQLAESASKGDVPTPPDEEPVEAESETPPPAPRPSFVPLKPLL